MRYTENYRLYTPDSGESILPLEDSRRFLTIDRQLLGLFQIFGNGVIEGWEITKAGGLNVSINPGRGHVFYISAQTRNPATVTLDPNTTNYIYAAALEETRYNRLVDFISSSSPLTSSRLVLLGTVTTTANAVDEIDTTGRNDISFIEQIKDLINQHRHRGGNDNPSKIDLASEVTGQLPSYRIEGIDALKIVSGRIPASRLPVLEHSSLLHSGILTHAQLDSFVRDLSNPNVRLLGELSTVNMLQLYLAMKHIWNEVDAYSTNQLVMIPGITPNSFIDLENTTALIDYHDHSIRGIPSLSGQLHYITYKTYQDFVNPFARLRIDIPQNDPNGDFFQLTRPYEELLVDGFDNVFSNETEYPDWTFEVVASGDTSQDKFVSDDTKKVDGPYSARMIIDQQFKVQVTRIFDEVQDWTSFNQFEIYIKSLSEEHGEIRIDILGPKDSTGDYVVLNDPIILLNINEITTGFKKFVKDITNITRDKVAGLRIYTDTSLGWNLTPAVINVDAITIINTLYYDADGFIRFRLKTPQKSQWAAISWDGDENSGQIRARARTASDFSLMDQTNAVPFSDYITNGQKPDVADNICMEFEISLNSDSTLTQSPVVRSITIAFITSSQQTGLSIDTTDEFSRATALRNVTVSSDAPHGGTEAGKVLIKGRVDTGDWVYGLYSNMQQVDQNGTPVLAIIGDRLFTSPMQAVRQNLISRQTGLDGVLHAERLEDRTYLIADTLNDRVLLFDENGNLVSGLVSNNARNIKELYPIQCSLNTTNQILYIAWSTNVTFADMDLSKIVVQGSGISVTLSNSLDKVLYVQGASAGVQSGNVTAIELSEAHFGALNNYINNTNYSDTRLFLDVAPEAVASKVDKSTTNYAALSGPRGLPVFIGNLQYLVGIYRPVSVFVTPSGNWLVSNAKPLVTVSGNDPFTGTPVAEIASVIEVNPETSEVIFSDNSVDFSLSTLGGAVEMNERYVAVCGIVKDSMQPSTSTSTTQESTGTTETTQTETVTSAEERVLTGYRGRVKIIEKSSARVVYEQATSDGTYGADVRLDENDNLVIIEKYFVTDPVYGSVGRGRVAKLDEDGNVYFQYGKSEYEAFNDVRLTSTGTMVSSS